MDYSGVIKAIDARFLPTVTIDEFFANTENVKKELEALAQRARPGQP
jgi:hypothetical protein